MADASTPAPTTLITALILGAIFFAPTLLAFGRKHPKKIAIALLNVLLGWTGLGWLIALIWSLSKPKAARTIAESSDLKPWKMGDAPIVAQSALGKMIFDGSEVTITRSGVMSALVHGMDGEKSIAISAIQAVQLRRAKYKVRGFLQLTMLGGLESRGGAIAAAGDENSLLFDVADEPAFERIAISIRHAISEGRKPVPAQAASTADELAKFAALRDQGVLSEEEFAAKKAKML